MSRDGHLPPPIQPHPQPQKIKTIMVSMYIDLNNTGCLYCCDTDSDCVYIPYYSAICQSTTQVNDTRKCQLVQYIKITWRHECFNGFIVLIVHA